MADIVDEKTRSRMMASVRSKDTKLEVEIRRRLHSLGFRYRLHVNGLPGKPDMIFPKHSAIILVHGCFWHLHGCRNTSIPNTRRAWWKRKLEGNRHRDHDVIDQLKELGWRVLVIWECSIRKPGTDRMQTFDKVANRAGQFLESRRSVLEIPAKPFIRDNGRSRRR